MVVLAAQRTHSRAWYRNLVGREYEGATCCGSNDEESCSTVCTQDAGDGDWGTLQIATPILVGVVLLASFSFYLLWKRKSPRRTSYPRTQDSFFSILRRKLTPRRTRHKLKRSSDPLTLDDSLDTPLPGGDFRRIHPLRSESTDSTTPLTSSTFEYPPSPPKHDPSVPLPPSKRQRWRWWHLFGMGPQEVKPKEVDRRRFRIDEPDASCTSHHTPTDGGHGSTEGDQSDQNVWSVTLGPVHEATGEGDEDEDESSVLLIGARFSGSLSTPTTPEPRGGPAQISVLPPSRPSTIQSAAPEYTPENTQVTHYTNTTRPQTARPSAPRKGLLVAPVPSRSPAPPVYSARLGPPPVLNRQPSSESVVRPLPPPPSPLIHASPRTPQPTDYPNPSVYQHERQFSAESSLSSSQPMTLPGMY
ncbi:hypothetical protein BV22DRAFT_164348 [Leucogyrophana mollusca]|uniref:Uncharacterized protein n=1 Tax=Leucogyrophana mollusca TaxID=85980 RepID=A0ACB8BWB9_9AGAM|nr:hypothetical protein BV22DRAFT_164348 [Leucogyrophana mollusca]